MGKGKKKQNNNYNYNLDPLSLQKMIIKSADKLVEQYEGLDYSIDSLDLVDELLGEIEESEWNKKKANMFGCYVFETARRNYGGQYKKEWGQIVLKASGKPDYNIIIMAFNKVDQRVKKGAEYSVADYVNRYKNNIELGKTKDTHNMLII